jgi:hypothetical protein
MLEARCRSRCVVFRAITETREVLQLQNEACGKPQGRLFSDLEGHLVRVPAAIGWDIERKSR